MTTDHAGTATDRFTQALRHGSVWDRELAEHLDRHLEEERSILERYETFLEQVQDEHVGYLLRLVLDDERRHHRILDEIANRVCGDAALAELPGSVPRIAHPTDPDQRAAILEATEEFLDLERADYVALRDLRRRFRPLRDTTLLALLVELMELDTKKHVRILEFLRDRAREEL
jgi:hypothetical protein